MKRLINIIILLSAFISFIFPQKTIAVLDFTTEGLENISISALPILVSREISKTKKYRLIERSAMQEIMKEQKFQLSGCVSSECAVEVGQLMGAEKMVTGTISALGDLFIIDIRLIDVETGEIENSEMIEHIGKIEDLLTPIKRASRKLFTNDVEELTESHIYIKSDPIGAKVYVNGILEGSSPLKKTIREGNYEVVVKATGYADWSQNIACELGETTIVDAVLMEFKSGGSSQVSQSTNSVDLGKWEVLGLSRDEYIDFLRLGINEQKWLNDYQPSGLSIDIISNLISLKVPDNIWITLVVSGLNLSDIVSLNSNNYALINENDVIHIRVILKDSNLTKKEIYSNFSAWRQTLLKQNNIDKETVYNLTLLDWISSVI